ncbi:MAG: hypothetical protein MZV64_47660 [Ignavibacteriales bacterium]|nr:hypothetical protein [Ignavibacteriales bacterium]
MAPVIFNAFTLKVISLKKFLIMADKIGQESSIEVTGKVKEEPRAPGGFELDATDLKVISECSRLSNHTKRTRTRIFT